MPNSDLDETLAAISQAMDKPSKPLKIIGTASGWLLIILIFVGAVLPILLTQAFPKGPGEFGDMFGAANTLFAAMAFFVVLVALWFQQQEIRGNEEANRKQLDLAQTTAKAQMLTFLADFHYTMMKGAEGRANQRACQQRSEYFAHRAVALLWELGESEPAEFSPIIRVNTKWDDAVMELKDITKYLTTQVNDPDDEEFFLTMVDEVGDMVSSWNQRFSDIMPPYVNSELYPMLCSNLGVIRGSNAESLAERIDNFKTTVRFIEFELSRES